GGPFPQHPFEEDSLAPFVERRFRPEIRPEQVSQEHPASILEKGSFDRVRTRAAIPPRQAREQSFRAVVSRTSGLAGSDKLLGQKLVRQADDVGLDGQKIAGPKIFLRR